MFFYYNQLQNNSNYAYDVKNNDIRNSFYEEYHFVMRNYMHFSSIILQLCENKGD